MSKWTSEEVRMEAAIFHELSPTKKMLTDYAERIAADEAAVPAWHDGAPGKPWSSEWFIAIMESGDRVVLRELPDEHTYDFTTADDTYVKRERIKRWMQFPDSQFTQPPAQPPIDLAAIRMEAYRSGFIEACKWPEPVTQDADSVPFNLAFSKWMLSRALGDTP